MAIKTRAKYVSKGTGRNVSTATRKLGTREYANDFSANLANKQDALSKGKDVYVTIPNPDKNNTRERFIRVKESGKEFLAKMKMMKSPKSSETTIMEVDSEMRSKGKSWDSVLGRWV